MSLREVSKAYPAVSRFLAGVWLKQWHFSSNGIITVLRNHFGFAPAVADVLASHHSRYITPTSLEAFFSSCDFVLGHELVSCHGKCDVAGKVSCETRECSVIIKVLQERFSKLSFPVPLF